MKEPPTAAPDPLDLLIQRAKQGDAEALEKLWRRLRPVLHRHAQGRLSRALMQRVDISDIVQQTLLNAHGGLPEFQGTTAGELAAWLQSIQQHIIGEAVRVHTLAQRRAVGREQSLDDRDGPGATVGERLVSPLTSPTGRLQRGESAAQLLSGLALLPADQREAVRLRHIEGRSLEEIAVKLGKTRSAAASLIKRGLEGLRRYLDDPGSGKG